MRGYDVFRLFTALFQIVCVDWIEGGVLKTVFLVVSQNFLASNVMQNLQIRITNGISTITYVEESVETSKKALKLSVSLDNFYKPTLQGHTARQYM
jgi:hypothetical protein